MFRRPVFVCLPLLLAAALAAPACSPGRTPAPEAAPPAAALTIACIGEQTTHSAHRENDPEYPTRMAELLGPSYRVLNFGLPKGRVLRLGTAAESESYLDSQVFRDSQQSGAQVFVVGPWGRHDTYPGNWPEHRSEFSADLEALVEAYRSLPSKPVVVVVTPLPFGGKKEHPIHHLLAPTREVAAKLGLPTIDLWSALLGHPEWYRDGTHLTAQGQQRHAQVIAEGVHGLLGKPD